MAIEPLQLRFVIAEIHLKIAVPNTEGTIDWSSPAVWMNESVWNKLNNIQLDQIDEDVEAATLLNRLVESFDELLHRSEPNQEVQTIFGGHYPSSMEIQSMNLTLKGVATIPYELATVVSDTVQDLDNH